MRAGSRHREDGLLDELAATVGSRREARWILEHVEDDPGLAGTAREAAARAMGERRAAGEPLQYVLGRWPFRSVELEVDRRVLVPRPETEQVVEVALGLLSRWLADPRRPPGPALCCDLGTGSGAIACAIAAEAPIPPGGLVVWATDRSPEALAVARSNRDRLRSGGSLRSAVLEIAEGDWYAA
ncbi:MAG TPA: hypothetical protein VKW77_06870, partial [Acidimicrobiales bacterium]|nr:hypothetical protein [Acidimicrobiales bacterium]